MKFVIELVAVGVLYWTIRLAVRHGKRDAWQRHRPEAGQAEDDIRR